MNTYIRYIIHQLSFTISHFNESCRLVTRVDGAPRYIEMSVRFPKIKFAVCIPKFRSHKEKQITIQETQL